MIRVVVVDDSAAMRGIIVNILSRDPSINVVGTAGDAFEARRLIKEKNPDVITLDIEMPGMDGLDFLERIMKLRPTPVVMISSATGENAEKTFQALEIGAFDCFEKSADALRNGGKKLIEIVRQAAISGIRMPAQRAAVKTRDVPPPGQIIAIGASTGGVEALGVVLDGFPGDCPPTVIVQHMPAKFTGIFASRLDRFCAPKVLELTDGQIMQPGHVYVAPGGDRHVEVVGAEKPRFKLVSGPPQNGHSPSVDVLFNSLAQLPLRSVGIILTGMGKDGAAGLLAMRKAGFSTIGQDERTSLVYGMPRMANDLGAVEYELPLEKISEKALKLCQK